MERYNVRYRTPNGSWAQTTILAENGHYAEQQAWAMFGRENVLSVLWESVTYS